MVQTGHVRRTAPRGHPVRELRTPCTLVLVDPTRAWVTNPVRRCNWRFGLVEAAWMLAGSNRLDALARVNSQMKKFSDDGETLYGAYGPRLAAQLQWVVDSLRKDPDSRQAVVTTWRPEVGELVGSTKDVPCTVAWHFQVRDRMLFLTVFMRSNDVWLGLPYDIASFTTIQRVVASVLGIEVGAYTHVPSNLHLYEDNLEVATTACSVEGPKAPRSPSFGKSFEGMGWLDVADAWMDLLQPPHHVTTHGMEPFRAALVDDTSEPLYASLMKVRRG